MSQTLPLQGTFGTASISIGLVVDATIAMVSGPLAADVLGNSTCLTFATENSIVEMWDRSTLQELLMTLTLDIRCQECMYC